MLNARVKIVAELSANHNNSIDVATKSIEEAAKCGVDAVKIQTFKPETIVVDSIDNRYIVKAGLWKGRSLIDLYKEAYTPWEWVPKLIEVAKQNNIFLFSSPFDLEAVDYLEKLNVPMYKIASPEIVDLKLIKHAAKKNKPLIISTGMANDNDISLALSACHEVENFDITLLHCISGYPTPINEMNTSQILRLKKKFKCKVGLSDHSLSNYSAMCAVALGAIMIEKHFTILKKDETLDGEFSLNINQLKALVKDIRSIEDCYGQSKLNVIANSEQATLPYRRSLYFNGDFNKGKIITENMVKSLRPNLGISPQNLKKIIGKRLLNDVKKNEPIRLTDFEN